jgi:hypothetical protein
LDRKLVEVAGVEGKRGTSQLLGGLEDVKVLPDNHTVTSPLSADASGQMLAAIVSNWHRLPDDLKRKMAELTGL